MEFQFPAERRRHFDFCSTTLCKRYGKQFQIPAERRRLFDGNHPTAPFALVKFQIPAERRRHFDYASNKQTRVSMTVSIPIRAQPSLRHG